MTCPRCQGLMVREWMDLRHHHFSMQLLRCVNCGCRLDWRIQKHQQEARDLEEQRQFRALVKRHWKDILWEEVKEMVRVVPR